MIQRHLSRFVLILAALAAAPAHLQATEYVAGAEAPAAQTATPAAVVERLHAALLESMRGGETLGYAGRVRLLEDVIAQTFDFPTIARIVTGKGWKDASEAQRESFIDVFRRLSIATYATNFSSFGGERFVTGESKESRNARIVETELVKTDGEAIPLNYMLHESNGQWLIVNVVAKGVSDLSLKRAEYTAVIQDEGLDVLIAGLEGKVSALSD
jgi:phospholipid transport system substrate-binding protein